MQIILLEKIANLGELGDVVNVKDGFGRNFLIPQGKAKRATEANKAEFETKRAELEKAQATLLKAAEKELKTLMALKLSLSKKQALMVNYLDQSVISTLLNCLMQRAIKLRNLKFVCQMVQSKMLASLRLLYHFIMM